MRLRYKASVVVACFVAFYMGLIPIYTACVESAYDCTLVTELIASTRLTLPVGNVVSIEYTGTVQGVEEPNADIFISQNTSFFTTMVIIPTCIILAIAFLERHKNTLRPGS